MGKIKKAICCFFFAIILILGLRENAFALAQFPDYTGEAIKKITVKSYCSYNIGKLWNTSASSFEETHYANKQIYLVYDAGRIWYIDPKTGLLRNPSNAWHKEGWLLWEKKQKVEYDEENLKKYLSKNDVLSCNELHFVESGGNLNIVTPDEYKEWNLSEDRRTSSVKGHIVRKTSSPECSANISMEFKQLIDNEIKNIENQAQTYMDELNNDGYTNLSAPMYNNLIETYSSYFLKDISKAKNNIKEKLAASNCTISEYDELISKFETTATDEMNKILQVIKDKNNEAKENASNQGFDTSQYEINDLPFQSKTDEMNNEIADISNEIEKEYQDNLLDINDENNNTINDDCVGILDPKMLDLINDAVKWVRIIAPILLIIFGCIDFGKAIIADDKDVMKKASSSFVKRCIIAIAIFFLPTLINILIAIFNSISDRPLADLINCGIK